MNFLPPSGTRAPAAYLPSGSGEHVQRERTAQQLGPIQSRRLLLFRFRLLRCLRRWVRLLLLRPCPRMGARRRAADDCGLPVSATLCRCSLSRS